MADHESITIDNGIKPANAVLALGWVLLIGGRWVIGFMLNMLSLVNLDQLTQFDDSILLPLYLVWLLITVAFITTSIFNERRGSKTGN